MKSTLKNTLSLAGILIGLSAGTSHATTIFTEDFEGYGVADGGFGPIRTITSGTPGGWTIGTANGDILNPAATGGTAAWLNPVPAALGTTFVGIDRGGWFYRDLGVTIEANTVYEFSLTHFKRDDLAGDAVEMRFLADLNTAGFVSTIMPAVTTNDTFVTRSIVWDSGLNASQNGNSLGILVFDSNGLGGGGANAANTAAIDNIIVTAVPEPSSFALLGLGGLGLILRRRR